MSRGFVGSMAVLSLLGLACFARLAADPTSLIVDGDRPSLDDAQLVDEPSIGNDLTRLFLPHHLAISRSIATTGHLPFWDDRGFGGRPMVGNPQAGLFYPPTWLTWWSGAPSSLGWITVGHLFFSGLGAYRLARTLGMGAWGSMVAAGCVQASPYVLAQTFEGHYPHVWAACWYPWAFDAAIRLRRGQTRSALSLALILAATFLAGHPQEGYYLVIALGTWAAFDGLVAIIAGRWRETGRLWGAWVVALVLAVGLIGIELIPDTMAQPWCLRGAKLTLRLAGRYHLYPINALQLLSPRALGGPSDYIGHENYWETVTSIGLIPLVLAMVGVAWSTDRRGVRGWLILVFASVLFASGRKLGLFAVLFEVVPGMDRFRVPARSLFLASLGASMLAGMGVEALRARWDDSRSWARLARRLAIGGFLVVLLTFSAKARSTQSFSPLTMGEGPGVRGVASPVARDTVSRRAGLALPMTHDRQGKPCPTGEPDFLERHSTSHDPHPGPLPGGEGGRGKEVDRLMQGFARLSHDPTFLGALGGTMLLLGLGWRRPDARKAVAAALGLLGLIELGIHGHGLIVTTPVERFLGPDPIGEALRSSRPPGLEPPRIRAVDTLYDDLRAGQLGFSKTNVNDSFQIQHAADLYQSLYYLFDDDGRPRARALAPTLARRDAIRQSVLDRMGVSFLVSDHLDPKVPWPVVASATWNGSTFAVHRNPSALPRAYVVPKAQIAVDDVSILDRFPEADPREAVLMAEDPLGPETSHRQPFTPAEWCSTDPDHIVLKVTTEAPGLFVVADTWMPGWSAEVDGQPRTILRGNRAQRVIPLPDPGRHDLILTYRPPGLILGVALTLASASAWLALLIGALFLGAKRASDGCH